MFERFQAQITKKKQESSDLGPKLDVLVKKKKG